MQYDGSRVNERVEQIGKGFHLATIIEKCMQIDWSR